PDRRRGERHLRIPRRLRSRCHRRLPWRRWAQRSDRASGLRRRDLVRRRTRPRDPGRDQRGDRPWREQSPGAQARGPGDPGRRRLPVRLTDIRQPLVALRYWSMIPRVAPRGIMLFGYAPATAPLEHFRSGGAAPVVFPPMAQCAWGPNIVPDGARPRLKTLI